MADLTGTLSDTLFAGKLAGEVSAGRIVALCSVLAARGSVPRHPGARMALLQSGEYLGTVGGGRIELIAQEQAEQLMAKHVSDPGKFGCAGVLTWVESRTVGMLCGGEALLAVRLLDADDAEVLAALASSDERDGDGAVLCEDWSDAGDPRWWVEQAGRGAGERTLPAPEWDEDAHCYREPLKADSRVYVFGGGHVASALVPVLAGVGFDVAVVEQRPELAVPERFPAAQQVIVCRYCALDQHVNVSPHDYVLVMTHEHALDAEVLARVAPIAPRYIGGMGSVRKAARVREILADRGVPAWLIDRIRMPVGDDIGAETPAEIAVSIAAELIRCRAN